MKSAKSALPIFFALCFVFGLSYYLFSIYRPDITPRVEGAKSVKEKKSYLDSIPLPTGSQEVGRNVRDGFSQMTLSSSKSSEEIQKFFRSVLVSKGWKSKDSAEDLLSTIYTRDQEKIEVSVLSLGDNVETVFSVSYFD
ncbi:MAG: hypothetical protein WC988_02815 [Patescibacteria group bacterium]